MQKWMTGKAKYSECIAECNKVISAGYTLEPVYRALFMKDNNLSNEIIFALNSDGKHTKNWGSTTFLIQAAIGGSMKAEDQGVTGGWAGLRTTKTLVEKFPDVTGTIDKRAIFYTDGQNLEINDIGVFTDGIAVPKYSNKNLAGQAGSDPTHADTDYPLFRLGDAYLMYAEAVLRGGTGGSATQALDYVNQLRKRAYGNDNGNITLSQLTLPFILDERARELYWEGTRRLDLVRYDQFTENGIWPWKGNVKEGKTTAKFRNIFPIPASDLAANPNLKQNPDY
ncbi:MAG: RagB/SusD family nutrient uptake outer membrane protein [Saprospiraceae bacterium]